MSNNWEMINGAMRSKSFEDSQNVYSSWAKTYTDDLNGMRTNHNAEFKDVVKDYLDLNASDKQIMLDLAAGTGRIGVFLREMGYKGRIHALDANKDLLIEAKKTGAYEEIVKQIVLADTKLNTPIDKYDTVFCTGALHLHHLPYNTATLVADVLKKDGYFVFTYRTTKENDEFRQKFSRDILKLVHSGVMLKMFEKDGVSYKTKDPVSDDIVTHTFFIYKKMVE